MNLLILYDEIEILQSKFKSLLLKEILYKDEDLKPETYFKSDFIVLIKDNERLQKLIEKLYLEIEIKDEKIQRLVEKL